MANPTQRDDIGALWDAAVLEYKKTAAVGTVAEMRTADEVMAMVVEKKDIFKHWRNDKGKLDRLRSAVHASLGQLNALGEFVGAQASVVFPPVKTIMTAVSYLIQTADRVSADYDLVVTFFEELHLFLERLKLLESHIPNSKDIRRCLIDILALILYIIGLSIKTMKDGRGFKFLKNLAQSEDQDLKEAYKRLERLVKQEEALMLHLVVANTSKTLDKLDVLALKDDDIIISMMRTEGSAERILSEIRRMREEFDKTARANHLPTIQRHLQPQAVDDYATKSSHLLIGTATWLCDEPAFQSWFAARDPQILFISGYPGSGKSYLSTFVIQQLFRDAPGVVAYYYFHDNNPDKQSTSKALSTMVYQIARADEVYCMHAAMTCNVSVGAAGATSRSIWDDFFVAHYGPTSRCRQLYLIFDGIDEAGRESMADLLNLLPICEAQHLKIQVLLVGRPEMDHMVASLEATSVATIEVSIKKNSKDIIQYANYSYDHSPKLPKHLDFKEKVVTAVVDASRGMFLWVELMFKDLSARSQPKQILAALQSLPKGLTKLYEKILNRIETEATEDGGLQSLRELLCWVAHSRKPMSLFQLNLIIQFLMEDELFDVEIEVNTHCSSLITLVKPGPDFKIGAQDSPARQLSELEFPGGTIGPIAEHRSANAKAEEDTKGQRLDDDEISDARIEAYQRSVMVELRHASLRDYLRDPKAKATGLIYATSEARVRVAISTIRMFCKGSEIREDLWLFALENWIPMLQDLDGTFTSDNDTKTIVECLVQIFYSSEDLQKHIAACDASLRHLFFGYNNEPQHPARGTILKWFTKAMGTSSIALDNETSMWIRDVLKHPMKLLVPLTKLCVSEWLMHYSESTPRLYWRYRFCSSLYLGTDLLPIIGKGDFVVGQPAFVTGSDPCHISELFSFDRDVGMHCCVARCAVFADNLAGAMAEYRKAEKKLTNPGTQLPILRSTLHELIELSASRGEPVTLDLVEEYIATDQSNSRIYASQGTVLLAQNRKAEAIKAFNRAVELAPDASESAFKLIETLAASNRYQDIMRLWANVGYKSSSLWVCSHMQSVKFHQLVFYAGLQTQKLDLVSGVYRQIIDQINSGTLQKPLSVRLTLEQLGTLACYWLALLYQFYAGNPEQAFHLYKHVLLSRMVFWGMDADVILRACNNFAELIYERAHTSSNDKQALSGMTELLENLCAHQAATEASDERLWKFYSQKILNVLLAELYLRCGRKADAQLLLKEQAKRGIDLLQDEMSWNDRYGYHTLSKVLLACGRELDARIALGLSQLSPSYEGVWAEENELREESAERAVQGAALPTSNKSVKGLFQCSFGYDCLQGVSIKGSNECPMPTMWTCTRCVEVNLCDKCHTALTKAKAGTTGEKRIFLCNPHHKFLRTPIEGWKGVPINGNFAVDGKETSIKDWLDRIEAEVNDGRLLASNV